ncbi:MAG: copper chaperone PCu(A)C [Pseudomonadota bacterium]
MSYPHHFLAALLALAGGATFAQTVDVKDAWVRAAVPGQKATGGFMKITARENLTLVGVRSPVAGITEVHEMKMDGDVMRMRALPAGLALPAGKTVELKPGGYHLMLLDLKQPLARGATVPLTLVLKNAKGAESLQALKVPVGTSPTATPAADAHKH